MRTLQLKKVNIFCSVCKQLFYGAFLIFFFYLKENRRKAILMLFLEHVTLVMVEYLVGISGES